jgi:hypothetical protein
VTFQLCTNSDISTWLQQSKMVRRLVSSRATVGRETP